jgi:hypothetical protein
MKIAAVFLIMFPLFFASAVDQKLEVDPTSKAVQEREDYPEENLYEENADAMDQTDRDLGGYRYYYGGGGGGGYGYRRSYSYGSHYVPPARVYYHEPVVVHRSYYNYYRGGKAMMSMGGWS